MSQGSNENTSLAATLSDIRKKFGQHSIVIGSEAKFIKVERVRTEIPSLDFALGGGFPSGRIIHVYGRAHSGKTFLCKKFAAIMQRKYPDKMVYWGDLEQVFDPNRAKAVGVDLSRIIVHQPSSAEESFGAAVDLARSGHICLAVYDSLAAVAAMAETDAEVADQQMGVAPRLINKFLRKWLAATAPTSNEYVAPTLLCTNQKREKIGGFRPMETTPGGRGIGFFASIELEVSHGDKISLKEDDDGGEPILIGHDVNFHVVKNNTFPLGKRGKFILCTRPYDLGGYRVEANHVDFPVDLLKYAIYYGVITKNGGHHYLGSKKLGGSKLEAQATVFHDKELAEEIYEKTMKTVRHAHGIKEEEMEVARKRSGLKKRR